jgi:hypothetical protein
MMSRAIGNFIIFGVGAAVGSVVTWQLVKTKYEKQADEEIKSVKEKFAEKLAKVELGNQVKKEKEDYTNKLQELNYIPHLEKGETGSARKPYVIPPELFDENDYETISLTYFDDGYLVNEETGEVVEDVEDTVGEGSLTRFGEYEDDSVFVRDDWLRIDYEILYDPRNYADVRTRSPRPAE